MNIIPTLFFMLIQISIICRNAVSFSRTDKRSFSGSYVEKLQSRIRQRFRKVNERTATELPIVSDKPFQLPPGEFKPKHVGIGTGEQLQYRVQVGHFLKLAAPFHSLVLDALARRAP